MKLYWVEGEMDEEYGPMWLLYADDLQIGSVTAEYSEEDELEICKRVKNAGDCVPVGFSFAPISEDLHDEAAFRNSPPMKTLAKAKKWAMQHAKDVLSAKGQLQVTDAFSHPKLFWAVCGEDGGPPLPRGWVAVEVTVRGLARCIHIRGASVK